MSALPCIVCHKALEQVGPDTPTNQPIGGTAFSTTGHYGSTAFDPMDGTQLEINICDSCLIEAANRDQVMHYPRIVSQYHADIWRP